MPSARVTRAGRLRYKANNATKNGALVGPVVEFSAGFNPRLYLWLNHLKLFKMLPE